jgi:rhodanese-related sulfurtransferase
VAVVDVREPLEFSAGHLRGAVNIPLASLSQRLVEIPPHSAVVFVCRSGNRSQAACEVAARAGRSELADLEGGMLAWAAMIDPAMTVAPFK